MTDTAQPATAAETVVSREDAIMGAAQAFKANLGQTERQLPPRADDGKFTRAEQEAQQIEAEDEAEPIGDADPEAESHEEVETDEAADEAQPQAVDLPPSWPAEHAETWQSLPPETQAFIAEREGQREAAVNAKFQEAANVRKANEALITEANTNAQRFAQAADMAISLIQPQRPPISMLQPGSHDYNPDHYHLLNAQADEAERYISSLTQQRDQALAQLQKDAETREAQSLAEIEAKARPALLKDVPELTDPQKQAPVLHGLVQYAISQGIPEYVFTDPEIAKGVTSAQLHITWKAQQYDKMVAAKGKVQPKAAKPSAPPVRPGVATSRSAVQQAERKKITERLAREGSVEAGAAFFKTLKF